MQVKILFFAKAKDVTGRSHCIVTLGEGETPVPATLAGALQALLAMEPMLAPILPTCSVAINQEFVLAEKASTLTLKEGDEMAILPPVSGG